MTSLLVTGGTGTLGRLVVPLLLQGDRKVRVLSRSNDHEPRAGIEYVIGDLVKDEGVRDAVDGTEIVLHLAGAAKGDDEATRNLVRAASRVGVEHLVYISAIGVDRMPLSWFKYKLGAERAVTDSGIPWTTLRAAQFHDLVFNVLQKMGKLPVVPVPRGLRFQPVDARDVAARLVGLALAEPAGLVPDLAGPRVYGMGELVHGYLKASGKRRPTMSMPIPGKIGRAYRNGENLALQGADFGERTWESFLAGRRNSLD